MNNSGYVSVDKLIDFANNHINKSIDANDIARFPRADVEEVIHSKWIKEEASSALFDATDTFYICNNCGQEQHYPYPNCPWCRAKMDADRTVEVDNAIAEIKMLEDLMESENN